jgi:hypothetical protein
MAKLEISLVERQRCAIEFCVRLGKWIGGTPLQPCKGSSEAPPETCGKRSAARFREVDRML